MKIDFSNGYKQIPVTDTCHGRSYVQDRVCDNGRGIQNFRMPFDVKNSHATLVRRIRKVLSGMAGVERRVVDDLMVFSSDWMTHLETLEELLRRFSKANLTARLSKCIFGTSLKSVFCVCSVGCSVTTKTISLSLR